MGLFDDLKKDKTTTTAKTQPVAKTGLFSDLIPEQKESVISKVGGAIKDVGVGIYNSVVNPDEEQKKYEADYIPYATNPILKVLTAPGVAAARIVTRVINPGLRPFANDVAEIYEVSRKNGVADLVDKGIIPATVLDDFAVLKKKNLQIVGDVAQAVLSVYSGGAAPGIAKRGVDQTIIRSIINGGKEALPVGFLFGAAATASSGDYSVENIVTTLGVSTVTAGILGGMLSGAIPYSKRFVEEINIVRDALRKKEPITSPLKIVSEGGTNNIPVRTPQTKLKEYSKSQGYEGYINPDELPIIDAGPGPKDQSGLPSIQMEAPAPRPVKGDITYEPIKPEVVRSIIDGGKTSKEVQQEAVRQAPVPEPQPRATVTPDDNTFVPALAQQVEKDAIEKNLVSRFEDLPEAKVMNMKQQASDAADLVASDYEKAKRVALGKETPPGELRDASVFEAVKRKALEDNDSLLLKQLATESTVPSNISAYAQQVKAADNKLVDTLDPVELMQSAIKSKEKKFTKIKSVTVGDIRKEIVKNAPKKQDWAAFINSIEC